jgi:tetratricopeptide (TPR) repeat protein
MRKWIVLAVVLVASAGLVVADQVTLTSGLPYSGEVTKYQDYTVFITLQTGRTASRELSEIGSIKLDGQADFNKAEEALSAKKFDDAIKAYDKAMQSAGRAWMKELIRDRRYTALAASGKVDRALKEWLDMVDKAGGPNAKLNALRPTTYGPEGSAVNKRAIAVLSDQAEKLRKKGNEPYLRQVLSMKMDLQKANGDVEAAAETALAIQRIGQGDQPSGNGNGTSRPRPPVVGGSALRAMRTLLEAGKIDRVAEQIGKNLKSYDAQDLPEALTLLGRAQLAQYQAGGGSADRSLLIKAGKNLVVVFAMWPGTDEAPEALYHAAIVNRELDEQPAVTATLEKVIEEYPDTEWAAKARDALEEK